MVIAGQAIFVTRETNKTFMIIKVVGACEIAAIVQVIKIAVALLAV